MNAIEALYRVDIKHDKFSELRPVNARDIAVKEKDIENWVVGKPQILFSDPNAVMIIASEITGEMQADVLAVDSQGNLIIIEIKRHWSDRTVIGQILDYAAQLSKWGYEEFNQRWKIHGGESSGNLLDEFLKFVDNFSFNQEDFLKNRRLYILAAGEDESMKRIISWLRDGYGVPIDFVPFGLYRSEDETLLRIGKIDVMPIVSTKWAGDWFFNSNETFGKDAYSKMIASNVIAAYGYGPTITEHKMNLPAMGERVFMYVNGKGILAVGKVLANSAIQSDTVFGQVPGDEYHRAVCWTHKVEPSRAISSSECSRWGYNLPVRCTIGKMSDNRVANLIEQELIERAKVSSQ